MAFASIFPRLPFARVARRGRFLISSSFHIESIISVRRARLHVLHIPRILLACALCSACVPRNNTIDSDSEGYIAKDNIARAKLHNRVYISSAGDPPAAGRERLHVARLARALRASLARR